jgi:hypothetical protein
MLILTTARVPAALPPSPPARPAPDPTEPSVLCGTAVEGTRVVSAGRSRARAAPPATGTADLDGEQIGDSRPPAHDELR